MEKATHTPLPWEIDRGVTSVVTPEGDLIATAHGKDDWERGHNAALIVRAVNNHDALLDCLRRHYTHTKKCGHDFDCVCLQDESRALIARLTV